MQNEKLTKDDYEKALDLAVEQINKGVYGQSVCPKGKDCLYDDWIVPRNCNECWKEYLLKEASKK